MSSGSFTVYRSSAGSGKTFTLVKEYLKIVLLDPAKFRNILAITFTNKAAAEMRSRVLKSLKVLSKLSQKETSQTEHPLAAALMAETGMELSVLSTSASRVLELILHQYSDFAVTTIDSFMHRVIRTFTFDLKLPAGFEVEMDQDKLLRQATDLLISEAGTNESLTRVLVEFSEFNADEGKGLNIEYGIHKLAKDTFGKEDSWLHLQRLSELDLEQMLKLRHIFYERQHQTEKQLSSLAADAWSRIQAAGLKESDFYQGGKGIAAWIRNLSGGQVLKCSPGSYVTTTLEEDKWISPKSEAAARDAIEELKPFLIDSCRQILDFAEIELSAYIIRERILKYYFPLVLLNEVGRIVRDILSKENLVLISEFNQIIAKVVVNEPIPFLYERLGVKYQHFLLDEFQDTSVLQWMNLMPLIENGLAEQKFSMLVGDGKQAIYRFRNGEVEQFSELPRIYKRPDNEVFLAREEALKRNYHEENLMRNYRSRQAIVNFNNDLYSFLSEPLLGIGQSIYRDHLQQTVKGSDGGYVMIENPGEDFSSEEISNRVADWIREVTDDGYQWKDIGILCRSNGKAGIIASALMEQGITVISPESLLLVNEPVVQFIMACLHYLDNPLDQTACATVIRYLHDNGYMPELNMDEAFRRAGFSPSPGERKLARFPVFLTELGFPPERKRLLQLPLFDICEELIRKFKLHQPPDLYIQFFLDAVLKFTQKSDAGLPAFLKWWEEFCRKFSVKMPEGMNAVSIMTVHKSKGLEFPVVILPLEKARPGTTVSKFWAENPEGAAELPSALISNSVDLRKTVYAPDYETETMKSYIDDLNVLYVATTRAAERMYILTKPGTKAVRNSIDHSESILAFLQAQESYNEDQSQFYFGERKPLSKAESQTMENEIQNDKWISEAWRARLRLSLQAKRFWSDEEAGGQREKGLLLHALMAEVKNAEDIDHLAEKYRLLGVNDSTADILGWIEKIKENVELMDLLKIEGLVLNEAEILSPAGQVYRPDRVVLAKDKTIVIDYKTGKADPGHEKQIRTYCELLRNMNCPEIQPFLVYLGDDIQIHRPSL